MNYKVSVIVPVYNTSFYLRNCIESILKQSHKDIEVLLINDGSTDNSGEICDDYAIRDSRVIVIHQNNKGLSNARNTGMRAATGDYFSFIDSDDWVDNEMIKYSLKLSLEKEADITMSTLRYESEFKNEVILFPWGEERVFLAKNIRLEFLSHVISGVDNNGEKIEKIAGSVCKCLFKSQFLNKNNIYFNEKVGSGQDKEFLIRALLFAQILVTTNKSFYHYNRSVQHGGSSTQRYSEKLYENIKYRQQCYIESLNSFNLVSVHDKGLKLIWIESIMAVINNMCFKGNKDTTLNVIKKANFIIKESEFNQIIKNLNESEIETLPSKKIFMIQRLLPLYIFMLRLKVEMKHFIITQRYRKRLVK